MNKNIKSYNIELFLQTLNTHFSEYTAVNTQQVYSLRGRTFALLSRIRTQWGQHDEEVAKGVCGRV